MSSYRTELENYLKTLDIDEDSVLDIGGSSLPVKDRVKSWSVRNYKILDNLQEKDTEKEHWQEPDFTWDLNVPLSEEMGFGKYDSIFCLEVFEYVYDPLIALKNIKKLLSKNGKLVVSLPFLYPLHNPMVHDCLRYTEFGIYKLMKEVGFEIIDMIPRRAYNPNLLSDFYKAEGLHPAKRYPSHDVLGWVVVARSK